MVGLDPTIHDYALGMDPRLEAEDDDSGGGLADARSTPDKQQIGGRSSLLCSPMERRGIPLKPR